MDRDRRQSGGHKKAGAELAPGAGRRDLRKWARQLEQSELGVTNGGELSGFEQMLGIDNPIVGAMDDRSLGAKRRMVAIVVTPAATPVPAIVVVPVVTPAPLMVVVAASGAGG